MYILRGKGASMGRMKSGKTEFRTLAARTKDRLTIMVTALILAISLAIPGEGAAFRNVEKGKPLPDFTIKDLAGMDHTLSAQKGKVVILGFVRVDQDRSVKTLNALEEINGVLKDDGITVWAVTSQTEDKIMIQSLVEKLNLQYPVLLDEGGKIYGKYGLFTFPVTAIVDQEGNLSFELASYGNGYKDTIVNRTRLLLGLISEDEFTKSSEQTEITTQSAEQKEAVRNLQTAKVLLKRGFGTKALPKLERVIELDPTIVEARLLAGEVYLKDEQYANAMQQFEKVFEVDENNNEARVGLASVLIAQNKLAEAESHLQKAVSLNPDPTLALFRLGQVYEKNGDTQKAMETYRDALEHLLKKSGKR